MECFCKQLKYFFIEDEIIFFSQKEKIRERRNKKENKNNKEQIIKGIKTREKIKLDISLILI